VSISQNLSKVKKNKDPVRISISESTSYCKKRSTWHKILSFYCQKDKIRIQKVPQNRKFPIIDQFQLNQPKTIES
jgi:hypothetical protein